MNEDSTDADSVTSELQASQRVSQIVERLDLRDLVHLDVIFKDCNKLFTICRVETRQGNSYLILNEVEGRQ